jgi:hypothetical protein
MRKSRYRDGSRLKVEKVPVSGQPEKVESVRHLFGSTGKVGASHLGGELHVLVFLKTDCETLRTGLTDNFHTEKYIRATNNLELGVKVDRCMTRRIETIGVSDAFQFPSSHLSHSLIHKSPHFPALPQFQSSSTFNTHTL